MMELAKHHLDVGMFVRLLDAEIGFCTDVLGLPFDHMARLGGGIHQHRFHMNGSILKVNHSRATLAQLAPSGFRSLRIARQGLRMTKSLLDAGGVRMQLVPPGADGVVGIGVDLFVRSQDAHAHFWREVMGFPCPGQNTYACGDSLIFVHEDPCVAVGHASWKGDGLRYITVQVRDCVRAHRSILARGAEEGVAPMAMGKTATISFVKDPDGNFIEISERHAPPTAPLPMQTLNDPQ